MKITKQEIMVKLFNEDMEYKYALMLYNYLVSFLFEQKVCEATSDNLENRKKY